ncbi:MAG TPA: hypothetical protein VK783_06125 [Bacteroidia bacterium]|jgi:hypothetical protein|nr:hypothetical protein [Bacteroidia bacterium]
MRKKTEYFILVIALLVFIVFSYVTQIYESYMHKEMGLIGTDAIFFFNAATNFYSHFQADWARPLGYPAIIGLPLIFNAGKHSILLWNMAVNLTAWILTSIFIFKTVVLFARKGIAIVASMIFLLCVGNLEYVYFMLSETVYICLLVAVVYFVANYLAKENVASLGWAYFFYCYSLLVRPTLIVIAPFVLFFMLYVVVKYWKIAPRKIMNRYILFFLLGSGIVLGQCDLMKRDVGVFNITVDGALTTYRYIGAYAKSMQNKTNLIKEWKSREETILGIARKRHWKELDSLGNADIREQLRNNTWNYFKALRIDISANTFTGGAFKLTNIHQWPFFDSLTYICFLLSYWQNVVFTFFIILSGVLVFFVKKTTGNNAGIVFFISFALGAGVIVTSGVSFWELNRFNIVGTPFVLINMALLTNSLILLVRKKSSV